MDKDEGRTDTAELRRGRAGEVSQTKRLKGQDESEGRSDREEMYEYARAHA